MKIVADWLMVNIKEGYQGVKERKSNEKLIRVSELQDLAEGVIELGDKEHEIYKYLFNDLLVVEQGVFKWNEQSKSFCKVSDEYDGISEPKPIENIYYNAHNELYEKIKKSNINIEEIIKDEAIERHRQQMERLASIMPKLPDLNK